jgi:hypothetical protein
MALHMPYGMDVEAPHSEGEILFSSGQSLHAQKRPRRDNWATIFYCFFSALVAIWAIPAFVHT